MSLKTKKEETIIDLNQLELYNESENIIIASNQSSGEYIKLVCPLNIDIHWDFEDYEIFLLHGRNLVENDIYELWEKNNNLRIGWIISIQSLQSKDHDFVSDQHFLKFAGIAFLKLINSNFVFNRKIPLYEENKEFLLEEFLDPNTAIVILEKKATKNIKKFDFNNYLPSLYLWDYCKISYEEKSNINPRSQLNKKLKISPVSEDLEKGGYITRLFEELLPKSQHKLVRFHTLYQIIEMLIHVIFEKKLRIFLEKVDEGVIDLIPNKDKIFDISSEPQRMRDLFFIDHSSLIENELNDKCYEFLKNKEPDKKKKDLTDSLYGVRCSLIHGYRNVTKTQENILSEINVLFEQLIIEILINYNNKKIEEKILKFISKIS